MGQDGAGCVTHHHGLVQCQHQNHLSPCTWRLVLSLPTACARGWPWRGSAWQPVAECHPVLLCPPPAPARLPEPSGAAGAARAPGSLRPAVTMEMPVAPGSLLPWSCRGRERLLCRKANYDLQSSPSYSSCLWLHIHSSAWLPWLCRSRAALPSAKPTVLSSRAAGLTLVSRVGTVTRPVLVTLGSAAAHPSQPPGPSGSLAVGHKQQVDAGGNTRCLGAAQGGERAKSSKSLFTSSEHVCGFQSGGESLKPSFTAIIFLWKEFCRGLLTALTALAPFEGILMRQLISGIVSSSSAPRYLKHVISNYGGSKRRKNKYMLC